MKEKKKHKETLKRIQEALSGRDGLLKPAGYSCNHKSMMKGEFSIGDNDELLFNISCLLKTCVLALEGEANFSLSALSNADPKSVSFPKIRPFKNRIRQATQERVQ